MMRTILLTSLVLIVIIFPNVGNAAQDDYGNLSSLSKHLGGNGDLHSLLEKLPPFVEVVKDDLSNPQYPIKSACSRELVGIAKQLASDTKVYQLSDQCLTQIEILAEGSYTDLIQPLPDNDIDGDGIPNEEDDDIDGDGVKNSNDDDIDGDTIPNDTDDDIDGDGVKNSDDSSSYGGKNTDTSNEDGPCTDTIFYNTDCTLKINRNSDGTVSFGSDPSHAYEQTDRGTFIDTETGEELTLAEVIERENVPVDVNNDHDGALSIIENVLNSANPVSTNDPATGAASNVSSSFGDMLSQFFGGGSESGSNSPLTSIVDQFKNIPGVGGALDRLGLGSGNTNGGTPAGSTDYDTTGFDGNASDFVGDIKIVNPDGPSQIVWLDSKNITPLTMSVLEYVSKRVEFPLTVTSTYRPNDGGSQHALKKAVDLRGHDLTDTQKVKLTQVILSHPEVGGYGTYPGDKSFHFDTRGGRVYWSGPPGSGDYQSKYFRSYCNGGPYTIHPMICKLVFDWAAGKSVGNVTEEDLTQQ